MRDAGVKERGEVPRVSAKMLRWFQWYCRGYLRKHVNSIRVAGIENLREIGDRPVVVCMNHPSWWDPLIAAFLADSLFRGRKHYAPIDADALENYSFFKKLGFFGVEKGTARGARTFLEVSSAVLQERASCLWVTVQGKFTDVRERPVRVAPGVGHLLREIDCVAVPMAIEIVHWEERIPEVLVTIGAAIRTGEARGSAQEWNAVVESSLEKAMDRLAAESVARNGSAFKILLGGKAGVGGVYDTWRAWKSRVQGRTFDAHHSAREATK